MKHRDIKTKRAVGYIRVSTAAQVDGESPKTQETSITEYCSSQEWNLVSIERDLGISGHKTENRPGWRKIMSMVKSGEVDVVICLKLSRIARNTREALNIEHELRARGVALVSLKEKFDTTAPSGKLNFQVLSMIAEFEREVIKEQMNDNKMSKWRRLEMFNGHLPYGYLWDKAAAEIKKHPHESEVLNKIMRLYVNAGMSMKDITIKLNSEGVRGRRAEWSNGSLSGIFGNPVYGSQQLVTNQYVYDEDGKRTKELKPDSEWITYEVPRIISLDLWQKVQARREFNKRKQKHTTWQQDYWLRDNLFCAHCGGKIIAKRGSSRKDGSFPKYYACFWGTTSQKDLMSAKREKCDSTYIYADNLEDYIWKRLTGSIVGNWHSKDEKTQRKAAESRFNQLFGSENIDKRITETQNSIQLAQKKTNGKLLANQRFAAEIEKDDTDISFFMNQIRKNQAEIALLKGLINELENNLLELDNLRQEKEFFLKNSDLLFDVWRDMQYFLPAEKKRFLESLVPDGIKIVTNPQIITMLGPTTVKMEIIFNSDIFQEFIGEGKFVLLGKNGSDDSA